MLKILPLALFLQMTCSFGFEPMLIHLFVNAKNDYKVKIKEICISMVFQFLLPLSGDGHKYMNCLVEVLED
ncbi:hypothetical protein VNO77_18712 [Canavalia gladiata]|uniref:Secreted protein n=1 Tax=Canavalia gladiata TaxID=3824 RepID=A0AAN9LLB0_CANGL